MKPKLVRPCWAGLPSADDMLSTMLANHIRKTNKHLDRLLAEHRATHGRWPRLAWVEVSATPRGASITCGVGDAAPAGPNVTVYDADLLNRMEIDE